MATMLWGILSRNQAQLKTGRRNPDRCACPLAANDTLSPPKHAGLLAACVGTGVQFTGLLLWLIATNYMHAWGWLPDIDTDSHSAAVWKGWFMVFCTASGLLGGCFSAGLYNYFQGQHWERTALMTAVLFPGFGVQFLSFLWIEATCASWEWPAGLSYETLLFLCATLLVSFVSSWSGFYCCCPSINFVRESAHAPVGCLKVSFSWLGILLDLVAAVLPVWVTFALYSNDVSVAAGLCLVVTSTVAAIVRCYLQLTMGDCHWWWRTFLSSSFPAQLATFCSLLYFVLWLVNCEESVVYALATVTTAVQSGGLSWILAMVDMLACWLFVRYVYITKLGCHPASEAV